MVPGIWKLPHPPTVLGVSDEHMWGDYSNFGFLHISAECNFSFNSLFSLYNFILSSYHSHTPPPPSPVHLPPPPPLPVIVYLSGLSDYRQMKILNAYAYAPSSYDWSLVKGVQKLSFMCMRVVRRWADGYVSHSDIWDRSGYNHNWCVSVLSHYAQLKQHCRL